MKVLVGAACVAILAVAAYFFWGEYLDFRQTASRQENENAARLELFSYAGVEPGSPDAIEKVSGFCSRMADKRYKQNDNSELVSTLVQNCSALGYR